MRAKASGSHYFFDLAVFLEESFVLALVVAFFTPEAVKPGPTMEMTGEERLLLLLPPEVEALAVIVTLVAEAGVEVVMVGLVLLEVVFAGFTDVFFLATEVWLFDLAVVDFLVEVFLPLEEPDFLAEEEDFVGAFLLAFFAGVTFFFFFPLSFAFLPFAFALPFFFLTFPLDFAFFPFPFFFFFGSAKYFPPPLQAFLLNLLSLPGCPVPPPPPS